MSDLYNRINLLCKERGTNITALCKKANVGRATLSELNAGRTKTLTLETAGKLAATLGVSVDELMGVKQKENPVVKSSELDQQLQGIDFALFGEVKDLTAEQKQDILDYIRFKKAQGQQGK